MDNLISLFLLGLAITGLNYFLLVRPLRERQSILIEVLKLFAAQREAALSGQKRAAMKHIYEDWARHHKIVGIFGGEEVGVLSAEIPGPKTKGW